MMKLVKLLVAAAALAYLLQNPIEMHSWTAGAWMAGMALVGLTVSMRIRE